MADPASWRSVSDTRGRRVAIRERISMRGTKLEILSSFDFNTTSSKMQSGNESVIVSVSRDRRVVKKG